MPIFKAPPPSESGRFPDSAKLRIHVHPQFFFALFLATLAMPGTTLAARTVCRDVEAIRGVVETFRTSILDRDQATIMNLFSDSPGEDLAVPARPGESG